MMNTQFTDEQIKAYAAAFREGDAIWSGEKWCEIVVNRDFSHLSAKCSKNRFIVNYGGELFEGTTSGFNKTSPSQDRYRVTTLDDYELQGGEKLVWLGDDIDLTFGKSYTVKNNRYNYIVDDRGDKVRVGSHFFNALKHWAVIPRYEQVKDLGKTTITERVSEVVNNKMKEDDGMVGIKVVEEVEYTGKYKVGDEVKIVALTSFEVAQGYLDDVGSTGVVTEIDNTSNYTYFVEFDTGESEWFNEATLELVKDSNEIKRNDDALDALRYAAKLHAETTSKSATHVSDSMLKLSRTSDEVDRPASSHYHTNNNGNDVWQFADDNLSDERVKGFHQINAIKYVARYEKKHDSKEKRIEDLKKAKVSIDKLIELEGME